MLRPSNRIFSKKGKAIITVNGENTTIDEYYTKKRDELLSDKNQVYGKPFSGAAAGFKQRVYEKWTPTKEQMETNDKINKGCGFENKTIQSMLACVGKQFTFEFGVDSLLSSEKRICKSNSGSVGVFI